MTNLDKLIAEFKDARSAATEGPWEIDYVGEITSPETDIAKILSYENAKKDSLFICLAANKSDKLIKIIEVMREAMEKSWWKDGHPDKVYGSDWFIAKLKDGRKVVLRELPDDYSHDYKTADETYFTKDWIVKWMPFPDGEFISPNDEALQQAEKIAGEK